MYIDQDLCQKCIDCLPVCPMAAIKVQDNQVQWIINTSMGSRTTEDSYSIRRSALDYHIPYSTTATGALSMVRALETVREKKVQVKAIQEYF